MIRKKLAQSAWPQSAWHRHQYQIMSRRARNLTFSVRIRPWMVKKVKKKRSLERVTNSIRPGPSSKNFSKSTPLHPAFQRLIYQNNLISEMSMVSILPELLETKAHVDLATQYPLHRPWSRGSRSNTERRYPNCHRKCF